MNRDLSPVHAELYALNRAALRKMDTGGTIAVTGHKSQDPDAVCSAMAMAALMRRLFKETCKHRY